MITVVGSYNVDFIIKVRRFPEVDETIFAEEVIISHGGKGSNQAVSAQRLESRTRLIAAVGEDSFGYDALKFWKNEGIDTKYVKVKRGIKTGNAYIILNRQGKSMIIVDRGANSALEIEDVKDGLDGKILLTQLEVNEDVVAYSLKNFDGLRILNPAPAVLSNTEILRDVDIITPNEVELSALAGTNNIIDGAERLLRRVRGAVIVTLGEKGCLVVDRSGKKELISAPKVNVVDETGAGDVFNGALASALLKGYDIITSARIATYIASYSVTKIGALGPTLKEVKAFLENLGESF
ncbi:MAG: ribokinase [Sulfolobaceae archaeon]